jgi:drug/metabolite transporter (DMT)-like permease
MNWFLIIFIAYFLNAVAMIIDKALLKKSIPEPVVYTFYIGLLGLIFIPLLMPFGFFLPVFDLVLISLLAGVFFIIALLIFFHALKVDNASQVIPIIGGLSPLVILISAFFLIGERLTELELVALFLIVIGSYIISLDQTKRGWEISKQTLLLSFFSALFFGLSYTLTKLVYDQMNFLNGFIWTRIGALLAIFSMLLITKYRKIIFGNVKKSKKQVKFIFLIGQSLGGLSFLLVNYAISLGSVTITNALQGLQYIFLFIIIILMSKHYPKIIKEKLNSQILIQKIVAIMFISLGLFFIAL